MSNEVSATIKVVLNGKEQEIKSGMTVSELLAKWRIRPELVTVEINEEILQKLDYDGTVIKAGDKINFVFYMGGGSELAAFFCKLPAASCRLNKRGA